MENKILTSCALFKGISEQDIRTALDCLGGIRREYQKDELIFTAGQQAEGVGIVLSGSVYVIQEDFWGNRSILAHVTAGGLFGEAFACAQAEMLPISVLACEKTKILLVDYHRIVSVCSKSCSFHSRLIENMLQVLAAKNIFLTNRMEHLSRRTTREKLLSYLSGEAIRQGGAAIQAPFSRQELADYLAVDRSALSRELGRMEADGLLEYSRNAFILKAGHE